MLRKTAPILLIALAGCSFDSSALDARRCSTDDDCERFGLGYACTENYCIAQGESCATDDDCAGELSPCLAEACLEGRCTPQPYAAGTVCPASHSCIDAACDAAGACIATARDDRCGNGLVCDGDELCIPDLAADETGCVAGTPPDLEDGVECTVGLCDDAAGGIIQDGSACECDTPGEPCENMTAPVCFEARCTADYTCSVVALEAGAACDDGASCTTGDTCDAAQNCTGSPNHGRCADDRFCNGEEVCDPADGDADDRGCAAGPQLDFSDGIECTLDSCDEEADMIVHDTASCGCLRDEDCVAPCRVGRCVEETCEFILAATGTSCDDGVACTDEDRCDDEGTCTGAPQHAYCSDNAFCNGEETCAPGAERSDEDGCLPGVRPEVDDGIDCTDDRCDETTDSIVNQPGDDCPCTEDEDCDGPCTEGTCVAFRCEVTPREEGTGCNDGIACTGSDECDGQGNCVGNPDDERCDDEVYCNGAERCDPEAGDRDDEGCIAGPTPIELYEDARECEVLTCNEGDEQVDVDDENCCEPDGDEGPFGDDTCSDGIDNDCDGVQDGDDPGCGFRPTEISGLKLWLDASSEDNFRTMGRNDDVEDWFDLSGNSNHASQNGMERPRLEVVEGQNRVRFNGDRYMEIANESNFDFSSEMTAIVVFSVETFDRDWQALLTKGDQTWRLHRRANSNDMGFSYNNFWGGHNISGGDARGGDLHQIMARWDDGSSDLWFNASHVADDGHLDGSLSTNDDPVWLGNNSDHPDRQWRGDIAEVIVYDRALNGGERALIFDYLRTKWSLP